MMDRVARMVCRTTSGLALVAFTAAAQAPGDLRIALVIGNSAYAGAASLVNPVNDAVAMSATLKTLGFAVVELRDGSRAQMAVAVAQVRERLNGRRGIGVLYYAGHGLQLDFRNYMVPVDARLASASDVPAQAIDVGDVIDAFKSAGNRMNILVLDACRDNPFAGKATAKGLAPLDAPNGTFLAYATAPGNVAEDGDALGGNGLYTGYLVKELQKPAARIEDVFKRVRLQVRQQSKGRQIPWESTSLEEDFFFNDGQKYTFHAEDLQRAAEVARQREQQLQHDAGQTQERERQQAATKALQALRAAEAERLKGLEQALVQARESDRLKRLSAEQAREQAFAAEKADWDRIKSSRSPDDFYAFLHKYPAGSISEQAQFRLDQLQQVHIVAAPRADGVKTLASGAQRYRTGDRFAIDTIDGFTGNRQRHTQRITYADAERVEINNGQGILDQMGGIIKNRFGVKDPSVMIAPADIAMGKRWRTAFTNMTPTGELQTNFWEAKVVALEQITVPAGTFKAFRIERRGEARSAQGAMTFMTATAWVDPETMLVVRIEYLYRSRGKITEHASTELAEIRRAPRPGP